MDDQLPIHPLQAHHKLTYNNGITPKPLHLFYCSAEGTEGTNSTHGTGDTKSNEYTYGTDSTEGSRVTNSSENAIIRNRGYDITEDYLTVCQPVNYLCM